MNTVLKFDNSKIRGITEMRLGSKKSNESWSDLIVILSYLKDNPDQYVPVTESADEALHDILLDTPTHLALSEAIFGRGAVISHDPNAYGTDAFAMAWANTRAAFASNGINLPENYTEADASSRHRAATCWVTVHKMVA